MRPVKEPVSTLHRAVMMTAEMLGRLITAPMAAFFPDTDQPVALPGAESGMDLIAWENALDDLTGTRQTSGTAQFLIDGEMFYPVLYDAIEEAERSIDVRLYIFDTDDVALDVANRLKRRGDTVRPRVMLDGLGSSWASGARPKSLPAGHRAPLSITGYLRQESTVTVPVRSPTSAVSPPPLCTPTP